MTCRDKVAISDSIVSAGIRFCIVVNIEGILHQIKKESVGLHRNKLFYFYQNLRLGNKLAVETNERSLHIMSEEFDNFLTFKLDLGYKSFRDDKGDKNLGLLMSLIPQCLSGEEFQSDDGESISKSPRGEIAGMVSYNYGSKSYTTYVNVEGVWTMFHDKHVKQLNFFENVVEHILLR